MALWTHPELGTFDDLYGDWTQTRSFEAFNVFANLRDTQTLSLTPTYSVETDEPGPPSEAVIATASLVIEKLPKLLEDGVRALWQDLTGSGPARSGMWWHGGLEHAFEYLTVPTSERDLYDALEPRGITISSDYGSEGAEARIQFAAEFEEEHGVSFLTDGHSTIGVGYSHDSSPFRSS